MSYLYHPICVYVGQQHNLGYVLIYPMTCNVKGMVQPTCTKLNFIPKLEGALRAKGYYLNRCTQHFLVLFIMDNSFFIPILG